MSTVIIIALLLLAIILFRSIQKKDNGGDFQLRSERSPNREKEIGFLPSNGGSVASHSKAFIAGWEEFQSEVKGTTLERTMSIFIHRFFIPDGIDRDKFYENWDVLGNPMKGFEEGYGTRSIREIQYLPPAYDRMFVAGYPDVYQWVQDSPSSDDIHVLKRLSQMPDEIVEQYFNDGEKRLEFYSSLISQFKREKGKLECAI